MTAPDSGQKKAPAGATQKPGGSLDARGFCLLGILLSKSARPFPRDGRLGCVHGGRGGVRGA